MKNKKIFSSNYWNEKHGKYWMVQWNASSWISFGIHIDFKKRYTGKEKIPYGPYFAIHFLFFIFHFGLNVYHSIDNSYYGHC